MKNSDLGGKSKNLNILNEKGFNVPKFITITSEITEKELLEKVNLNLKSKYYAVRSSAGVEDGTKTSYAGHFYSAVGVEKKDLFEEFIKVRKSFGEHHGSVIIQEFIPSQKSGVLFTNAGNNQILINANFGLCKTVVEGEPCDEYIVNQNKTIEKIYIEKNKKPLVFENGNIIYSNQNSAQVLSDIEFNKLISTCLEIEKLFSIPQDIEWCFYEENLFILQSRPITRQIFEKKEVTFYDSANIAESYSGIVKPLTLSFAAEIYKTVYINLLTASGVSKKKVKKYQNIFVQMTASFYGRLYYNMTNWYLMMKFLPGYDRNKENLEEMITSNIREELSSEIAPSVWLKIFYPAIVVFKMFFFSQKVRNFEQKVRKYIKEFRKTNLSEYSINQCFEKYFELEKELLQKWHITVENDFLMMTYLGILKKKFQDEELQRFISFENKSARQVENLKSLVDEIYKIEELKNAVKNEDVSHFDTLISENQNIKNLLVDYFELYGGRFANELKLESSDIEEDKTKLLKLFKLYENFEIKKSKKNLEEPNNFFVKKILKRFKKYASKREDLRLLRSNVFSIVRKLFNRVGEELSDIHAITDKSDIYYLRLSEIFNYKNLDMKKIISERKEEYKKFANVTPLAYFSISSNDEVPVKEKIEHNSKILKGRSCTPGKIRGKVKVFKEYYIPDIIDFEILVTKNTDPGWTTLIGLSKGMIIENGGILSHAAIVSRELEIPTIIGVENVVEILKDNQIVEIDGSSGKIEIIE